MKEYTSDYVERCQLDHYCKLVLYHEAIDYLREMQRYRNRQTSLEDISPAQWDKLSTLDEYPSDSFKLPLRFTLLSGKGVWGFPQQAKRTARRGGMRRFSEVWLHFLCLLFLFFSVNRTSRTPLTARKIRASPEKSAKNKGRFRVPRKQKKTEDGFQASPASFFFGCSILMAPSIAPSMIGRYSSGQSFSL